MLSSGLRIDAHVHMVGDGNFGSGCSYPNTGRYRWMVPLLARLFGIKSQTSAKSDFDRLYIDRLLDLVQTSSLDAVVLLSLDHARTQSGAILRNVDSFYVPDSLVLDLAEQHQEVLPGISVHPARADAIEALEIGLERGAVLLKLIPSCQNIDLSERRYRPFWRHVAEAGLPLLVHTGREDALQELRPEWGHPRVLETPLREGVTVIAAHCGGIYQDEFIQMLSEFPRLFGDTSAFSTPFSRRRLRPLLVPYVRERLLHGSDLPVPVSAYAGLLRGELGWMKARELAAIRNPLERDYQIKRASGFPDAVFTRANEILRINRRPISATAAERSLPATNQH